MIQVEKTIQRARGFSALIQGCKIYFLFAQKFIHVYENIDINRKLPTTIRTAVQLEGSESIFGGMSFNHDQGLGQCVEFKRAVVDQRPEIPVPVVNDREDWKRSLKQIRLDPKMCWKINT